MYPSQQIHRFVPCAPLRPCTRADRAWRVGKKGGGMDQFYPHPWWAYSSATDGSLLLRSCMLCLMWAASLCCRVVAAAVGAAGGAATTNEALVSVAVPKNRCWGKVPQIERTTDQPARATDKKLNHHLSRIFYITSKLSNYPPVLWLVLFRPASRSCHALWPL